MRDLHRNYRRSLDHDTLRLEKGFAMHLARLGRLLAMVSCAVVFTVAALPGCGRSSLDADLLTVDAGTTPGAATCGPATCPDGCCDEAGRCRVGSDVHACGTKGGRCTDCLSRGVDTCGGAKTCGKDVAACDAAQCPNGCCSVENGRARCLAGTDAVACGRNASACVDCAAQGRACDPSVGACSTSTCGPASCPGCCVADQCVKGNDVRACGHTGGSCQVCAQGQTCTAQTNGGGACTGTPACGPDNCAGCCKNGQCLTGIDVTACGRGGLVCADCSVNGTTCVPPGQANAGTCQAAPPPKCGPGNCAGCCAGDTCIDPGTAQSCGQGGAACVACAAGEACTAGACKATCTAQTCPNGCCAGDVCVAGTQNVTCGTGGAACTDCTAAQQTCQNQKCQTPACGPANCAGCCEGDVCLIGFGDAACGANGGACVDCTAQNATCNTNANPRVCQNLAGTCPAAYGGCAGGATTPITATTQNLCADLDLDAIATACAGGPTSPTCVAAFDTLQRTAAPCAACLAPFDVAFGSLTGLYRCAAPFVSATCNHATGCASDCLDTSCRQCPAGASTSQCQNQVIAGQCLTYTNPTSCILSALRPNQLCSPVTYGGSFARWLRAVGDHYCGNGP